MDKVTGYVTGVNGNLVAATFSGSVRKNEVGYVLVGDDRLKGEVIRVNGDTASMQIYEMTNGIQVGDKVELSGELMSVELGPGLLTQVFDGLQNPLPELAQQCGFFLQRGVYLDPIPNKDWEFTPLVKPGDHVTAGDAVGSVPEGLFTHLIMVPFGLKDQGWRVKSVREKGVYNVRDTVAVLENESGEEKELTMVFSSFLIIFMDRGASEISTNFGLNHSYSDILTGIILFFIIGCEFFITYRLQFRKKAEKEEQ